MMCDNITRRRNAHRTLIVVNNFSNAKAISGIVRQTGLWDKVIFVEKRPRAFTHAALIRPDELYIDTDVGSRMFRHLLMVKCSKPSCKVFVYEEGQNTYQYSKIYFDDNRGWIANMRRHVYPKLGYGVFYGGSYWCDGIYLCNPKIYKDTFGSRAKKTYEIETPPAEYCARNRSELFSIFCGSNEILHAHGSECIIYLSAYTISESFLQDELFASANAYRVIKPHPRIKNPVEKYSHFADSVIASSVPAELLLLEVAEKFERVHVYHHGSSIERYINSDNMTYTKIRG